MENKYFNRALSNFVQDMASGAAIRVAVNDRLACGRRTDAEDFYGAVVCVDLIEWIHNS